MPPIRSWWSRTGSAHRFFVGVVPRGESGEQRRHRVEADVGIRGIGGPSVWCGMIYADEYNHVSPS